MCLPPSIFSQFLYPSLSIHFLCGRMFYYLPISVGLPVFEIFEPAPFLEFSLRLEGMTFVIISQSIRIENLVLSLQTSRRRAYYPVEIAGRYIIVVLLIVGHHRHRQTG